jgi:hypothetical protein
MPQMFRVAPTMCYVFPLSDLSTCVKMFSLLCSADIYTLPTAHRLVCVCVCVCARVRACVCVSLSLSSLRAELIMHLHQFVTLNQLSPRTNFSCIFSWPLLKFDLWYSSWIWGNVHWVAILQISWTWEPTTWHQIPISFILYYETQSSACRERQFHLCNSTVRSLFLLYC